MSWGESREFNFKCCFTHLSNIYLFYFYASAAGADQSGHLEISLTGLINLSLLRCLFCLVSLPSLATGRSTFNFIFNSTLFFLYRANAQQQLARGGFYCKVKEPTVIQRKSQHSTVERVKLPFNSKEPSVALPLA